MPRKLMERLLKEKKLKRQEAGFTQVEKLLEKAVSNLAAAKKIRKESDEAAYLMAYNGMLKAGRALLLLEGYVPDDGAQHRTVVEVTKAILGVKFKRVSDKFEGMRRKRNILTYDFDGVVTATESADAISEAIELLKGIVAEVKTRNPQLNLNLEA